MPFALRMRWSFAGFSPTREQILIGQINSAKPRCYMLWGGAFYLQPRFYWISGRVWKKGTTISGRLSSMPLHFATRAWYKPFCKVGAIYEGKTSKGFRRLALLCVRNMGWSPGWYSTIQIPKRESHYLLRDRYLRRAVKENLQDIILLLVAHGADPNIRNEYIDLAYSKQLLLWSRNKHDFICIFKFFVSALRQLSRKSQCCRRLEWAHVDMQDRVCCNA